MGRPRKPIKELELSGSLDHDPKRYANRLNPPKPAGKIGAAPPHFDAEHRAMWAELVKMAPKDLLGGSDRHALEVLCTLTVTFRKFGIGGRQGVSSRDLSLMCQLWDKLGLTPIGRARLNLPKNTGDDEPNEFAEYLPATSAGVQ